MDLKKYIRSIPDYPKKGILFRDITTLIKDPKAFEFSVNKIVEISKKIKFDKISAIESRGFIFGTAIALKLSKPLVLARKPGKLPGSLIERSYSLEYGKNTLSIQKSAIEPFKKFAIVDDLLATGGTANCVYQLITEGGKEVTGLSVVAELNSLKGRDIFPETVFSEITL